jgi:hypothetical protein
MIDKVTDPRSKRIHTRYSIPDTRAVIRFGDRDIQAEVINISTDGILCELNCPRPSPDLTTAGRMSIHLPTEYSTSVLQGVYSQPAAIDGPILPPRSIDGPYQHCLPIQRNVRA